MCVYIRLVISDFLYFRYLAFALRHHRNSRVDGRHDIAGNSRGSICRLFGRINRDTWKASEAEIASWEALENGKGGRDLDCFAKRGFAALLRVARAAVSMTQPIRLDYDG